MLESSKIMLEYNSHDLEVRTAIASAEHTPAWILNRLSKDPDTEVRKAVASNPNTVLEILEKLGEEFPETITDNPIFNLLLLENPDGEFVRLSLTRSSATFDDIHWAIVINCNDKNALIHICNVLDKYLRRLAAEYPNTFLLILKKLTGFGDIYIISRVREILIELAKNYNTSLQILEELASYKNICIRQNLAENLNTPLPILEKLVTDENEFVRRLARQNLLIKLGISTE